MSERQRWVRGSVTFLGAAAVTALLAGCASTSDAMPRVAQTVTRTPESEPTAPAPTATGGSGAPAAVAPPRCTTSDLTGSVEDGGGPGMSQTRPDIVLTNSSDAACTIQGWPGLSIVGGADGVQIGAAADLDRSGARPTVTLAAGKSAKAATDIIDASAISSAQCDPSMGRGFRVYPPGETKALFIPYPIAGCAAPDEHLMSVDAFMPAA